MAINQDKLMAFMGKAVVDMGAAASAVLCALGERLGLYKAMAGAGPVTPAELAKKTGTSERQVREWLYNQAAGGYLDYDAKAGRFSLSEEHALALADENSPVYIHGAFDVIASLWTDRNKVENAFRTGKGMDWGDHDPALFCGTERFFRPGYNANLIASWLPALDGVVDRLKKGAKVADVGCGHGASTIIMAKAFPKSTFIGIDAHQPSLDAAAKAAEKAGVSKNCSFKRALSTDFPGGPYDFVCFFDCLHDMGDPVGASKHVLKSLAKDGTWMIVEPMAGDRPEQNLNPVGRLFYAASTCICVPASLAHNGPALGAQAGEAKLREVVTKGGFTRFRRATETPFNMVLEARP